MTEFERDVYEIVKKIPRGKVATYGQIAGLMGDVHRARAVGGALHKNPNPDKVPCYRVVNAKGEPAKHFAFGGDGEQKRLLLLEGIEFDNGVVNLKKYQWDPQ